MYTLWDNQNYGFLSSADEYSGSGIKKGFNTNNIKHKWHTAAPDLSYISSQPAQTCKAECLKDKSCIWALIRFLGGMFLVKEKGFSNMLALKE